MYENEGLWNYRLRNLLALVTFVMLLMILEVIGMYVRWKLFEFLFTNIPDKVSGKNETN